MNNFAIRSGCLEAARGQSEAPWGMNLVSRMFLSSPSSWREIHLADRSSAGEYQSKNRQIVSWRVSSKDETSHQLVSIIHRTDKSSAGEYHHRTDRSLASENQPQNRQVIS
jgi:hypothetical protein